MIISDGSFNQTVISMSRFSINWSCVC